MTVVGLAAFYTCIGSMSVVVAIVVLCTTTYHFFLQPKYFPKPSDDKYSHLITIPTIATLTLFTIATIHSLSVEIVLLIRMQQEYKPLPQSHRSILGATVLTGVLCMYSLFISRLWVTFTDTVYEVERSTVYKYFALMALEIIFAVVGVAIWTPQMNSVRVVFVIICFTTASALHLYLSFRLVYLFVFKLFELIRERVSAMHAMNPNLDVKTVRLEFSVTTTSHRSNHRSKNKPHDIKVPITVTHQSGDHSPRHLTPRGQSPSPRDSPRDSPRELPKQVTVASATDDHEIIPPRNTRAFSDDATATLQSPTQPSTMKKISAIFQTAPAKLVSKVSKEVSEDAVSKKQLDGIKMAKQDLHLIKVMTRYTVLEGVAIVSTVVGCVLLVVLLMLPDSAINDELTSESELMIVVASLGICINSVAIFFTNGNWRLFGKLKYDFICSCLHRRVAEYLENQIKTRLIKQQMQQSMELNANSQKGTATPAIPE